jgi:xanthine dehydrogenase accessory factor
MDDVLAKAEEWRAAGEEVAIATVVATRRSAPRPLGSKLAVTRSGRLFGSVSGGCVEADVAERCQAILDGELPRVVSYGIADDEAWTVGLPCGGEIDVFLEPYGGAPDIERGTSYVVVEGEDAGRRWTEHERIQTGLRERVFAEAVGPPPRLVAVGAGDIAEALCALAKPLGWRTVVVDPRAGLANRERVPSADEILVAWPDQVDIDPETALVSLVHEERIDIPALKKGVEGGAFYVGALGSRRNNAARRERLREFELSDAELARLHGPVGIYIGSRTPPEIAISILAEVTAAKNGISLPTMLQVEGAKAAREQATCSA